MRKVEFYGYSRCSTCRDAESLMTGLDVEIEKRDLFAEPLRAQELEELFRRIGCRPSELLSTRSRPYRELGLAERSLSETEIVELMAQHPALVRRPIVVRDGTAVVGFKSASITELVR